jgi:hypothetical protein
MSHFGERLKCFRTFTLKLSREEFCEKYDVVLGTLRSWENNGTHISEKYAQDLKKMFLKTQTKVDYQWLFDGDGEQPNTWVEFKEQTKKKAIAKRFIYTIDSDLYEPILKMNTELLLEPTPPEDLSYPCFVALQDTKKTMHIGLMHETIDHNYVLQTYHHIPYMRSLNETDSMYAIIDIISSNRKKDTRVST